MATFRTGQQTHPTVLPQQLALEFGSADTPGIRDETGPEHHLRVVSGVEHVRGETGTASPGGPGVIPDPDGVGEQGCEAHTHRSQPYVFVLDKNQTPLQPCPPARARKLLDKGRAVVARHAPFTIHLKDRTVKKSQVDGVEIGIDPGSKHTGIAVFTHQAGQRRARYAVQLDHRGAQIRKKMGQRAAYRRRRRSKNLRYRAPRFLDRTHPQGWLALSLRHRVETTLSWVDRLARWASVRAVHVERVAFDTHALSTGKPLEGVEYQRGTLAGYEVRRYLLAKFDRTCTYCGATNTPLDLDHVHPRSRGGSDRVANLVLACVRCDQAENNQSVQEFITDPTTLARILSRAKVPLRDAAAVQSTRWALWRELDERLPTHVASGGRTKWNRTRNHLPKSHTLDAMAVGKVETITQTVDQVLVVGCSGRGSYARTRTDKYGFPRLRLPRTKGFFGFVTGDLVGAVVATGKWAGTHTGRVAVRSSGSHTVTAPAGLVKTSYKNLRLLQRADGYAYTTQKEERVSSPA